jgi:threonine dehydratase
VATTAPSVDLEAVRRARAAGEGVIRRTPVLTSRTLSEACSGTVVLKAENLQRTGSFKLRGALSELAALGDRCARGVVAASAGNHAQGLAYAARVRGVPCEVFMPADAPIAKLEATESLGARVHLGGEGLEACVDRALRHAEEAGMTFVHPFDDPHIVAGQGTLGLELVEDVPDLAKVVVPLGGGGLVSGVAVAVKSLRPEAEVVGVQVDVCAPYPGALSARAEAFDPPPGAALTIADGIAVKRPGGLTLPLVREWVDDVVVVPEDEVAEAMVLLLERAKLVVEGAGAVGVAALLGGQAAPAPEGTTVVVLSGGNVDAGLLAAVARRHETEAGRRLVLFTRVPDRPGALAGLLQQVAAAGANLVDVEHVREGVNLHVRETAVQLVLETRGRAHAERVQRQVADAGYECRVVR